MAHFAQLDENNKVIQVIVVANDDIKNESNEEDEQIGIQFCKNLLGQDTNWVQTSYSGKFRKNFASIGFSYDKKLDAFIPPKIFSSWILNKSTCIWEAPTPYPSDDNVYTWNEDNNSWEVLNI